MSTDIKVTSARAFVRSLNILLKFARLYGFAIPAPMSSFRPPGLNCAGAMPTRPTGPAARRGR